MNENSTILNESTEPVDLLEDIRQEWQNEPATTGQRFANYIIDLIVFYIIIFGLSFLLALLIPDYATFAVSLDGNVLVERIIGMLLYGAYMGVIEGLMKGRSFGKFVTRTRAIGENGAELSFSKAMLRGLSRIVPFEQLSALSGNPWHDRWTQTSVVKVSNRGNE